MMADAAKLARGAARAPGAPIPRTLQQAMRGHVFQRGSRGFAQVALVYNQRFDTITPQAVARPLSAADVQGAVRWAVGHGVPLRARSGGHSYAGYSTLSNGVVLDLTRLRGISINLGAGTATIGAGAQLIDVYAALAKKGVTIPAGSCPSVGIGGHVLGGGMGLAGRAFGLATDNIVAAQIVTAEGRIRQVDKRSDPDLLWALRGGGGGNFGVVTQLTLKLHRLPSSVASFFVSWPWSSASEAIAAWQSWQPRAPDQLTSIFHLNGGGGTTSVNIAGQYLGPASGLGRLLAPPSRRYRSSTLDSPMYSASGPSSGCTWSAKYSCSKGSLTLPASRMRTPALALRGKGEGDEGRAVVVLGERDGAAVHDAGRHHHGIPPLNRLSADAQQPHVQCTRDGTHNRRRDPRADGRGVVDVAGARYSAHYGRHTLVLRGAKQQLSLPV